MKWAISSYLQRASNNKRWLFNYIDFLYSFKYNLSFDIHKYVIKNYKKHVLKSINKDETNVIIHKNI